jgi:hypothetical protein
VIDPGLLRGHALRAPLSSSRTVDLVVTTNPGGESKTLVAWVARSNVVIVG